MEQQKHHGIALMKHSAIVPVISGLPTQYQSFSEYFREVAERGIPHPDRGLRHYALITLSNGMKPISKTTLMPRSPPGALMRESHENWIMPRKNRSSTPRKITPE